MTDQRDKAKSTSAETAADVATQAARVSVSRRALLRGASFAAPAVLTLNSNAAFGWAVASGTIGTRPANPNATGDATCLDLDQATGPVKAGVVYEADPTALVEVRGDLQYQRGPLSDDDPNDPTDVQVPTGEPLNAEQVCEDSGSGDPIYYYDGSAWQPLPQPSLRGAVVSVGAVNAASFALLDLPRYPV